ncbi:MAG: response regulator [Candidatus Heimdallarchaeota archaeon]
MARILIVDDEKDLALLLEEILTLAGHQVIGKAYDGVEAVRIYQELQKNSIVVLMDYRMPLKNGIEASKEILAEDPDCKIIFISADVSIKEEALDLGIAAFFEKPALVDDLAAFIQTITAY